MKRFALVLVLLAAGCGGSDQTVTDAGGDGGGTGNDATTGNDGGNPGNDGGNPGNDGGNPGNDGGTTLNDAGNPATVPCGTTSCASPQVCCVDTTTQTPTYTCAATCPQNTTTLKCIGNDCGSQVCCVFLDQNNQTASQCQASCNTNQNQAQLCQNTDAGPTGCTQAAPCSSQNIGDWGLNPPFGTCGGVGN